MSHRDIRDDILALGSRWATAEAHGDAAALDHLAHSDFRLVGPFGFASTRRSGWTATAPAPGDGLARLGRRRCP